KPNILVICQVIGSVYHTLLACPVAIGLARKQEVGYGGDLMTLRVTIKLWCWGMLCCASLPAAEARREDCANEFGDAGKHPRWVEDLAANARAPYQVFIFTHSPINVFEVASDSSTSDGTKFVDHLLCENQPIPALDPTTWVVNDRGEAVQAKDLPFSIQAVRDFTTPPKSGTIPMRLDTRVPFQG